MSISMGDMYVCMSASIHKQGQEGAKLVMLSWLACEMSATDQLNSISESSSTVIEMKKKPIIVDLRILWLSTIYAIQRAEL